MWTTFLDLDFSSWNVYKDWCANDDNSQPLKHFLTKFFKFASRKYYFTQHWLSRHHWNNRELKITTITFWASFYRLFSFAEVNKMSFKLVSELRHCDLIKRTCPRASNSQKWSGCAKAVFLNRRDLETFLPGTWIIFKNSKFTLIRLKLFN